MPAPNIYQNITKKIDIVTLLLSAALAFIGLISIYSATIMSDPGLSHFNKQLIISTIGLFISVMISLFSVKIIKNGSMYFFIAMIFLLILVKFIGRTEAGTTGWLLISGFSLQPSELMKLGFILMFAKYMSNRANSINNFRVLMMLMIIFAIPFVLIFLQPDFGTSVVLFVIFLGMLFWTGADLFYIVLIIFICSVFIISFFSTTLLLFSCFVFLLLLLLFKKKLTIYIISSIILLSVALTSQAVFEMLPDHQKRRIEVFTNPDKDPLDSGYNVMQSKLAIGSGGIYGKGFGQGAITQLKYVPKQWTDFIFSVPAEEFGLVGSVTLLFLLICLIIRIINVAYQSRDNFSSLVCFGVAILLFFHTIVNVGMSLGIFPVMGIPLPFISQGGSSLLTNLLSVGIVMSINRNNMKQKLS